MTEFIKEALDKIERGKKENLDRHGNVMKEAVGNALETFVRQDAEFAQAVAQGGSFKDCMGAVSKGVGQSISDLEAFRRAVQFYFKGADVEFQMRVNLCAEVERAAEPEKSEEAPQEKIINLEDFF